MSEGDLAQLIKLIKGHPYLTRKALYTMVVEEMPWSQLARVAPTDEGPFGDQLRRYRWMLRDQPGAAAGFGTCDPAGVEGIPFVAGAGELEDSPDHSSSIS